MLLIPCPWCGPREEIEMQCGGEAGAPRPVEPSALDEASWTAWLWSRRNRKGPQVEAWWHQAGCGRWFLVARDTRDDRVLAAWPIGGPPPPELGLEDHR